jgi:hypothetical protein
MRKRARVRTKRHQGQDNRKLRVLAFIDALADILRAERAAAAAA